MPDATERPRSSAGGSATPARRQRIVEILCEAFAQDRLGLQELEARLDRVNRVASESELRRLVEDLGVDPDAPPGGESRGAPVTHRGRGIAHESSGGGTSVRTVDPSRVPDRQLTVAFWSGRARKGSWIPARRISAVAFQGGIELDFREALLGPVTEVRAVAFMGAVEILLPPGVRLESSGFAVMGAFEDDAEGAGRGGPDGPLVRLTGVAFMGAVEVVVRRPGETARQARDRKRRETRRLSGPDNPDRD